MPKRDKSLEGVASFYYKVLTGKIEGVYYKDDTENTVKYNCNPNKEDCLYSPGIEEIIKTNQVKDKFDAINLYINPETAELSLKKNKKGESRVKLYVLSKAKKEVDNLFKENHWSISGKANRANALAYLKAVLDATLYFSTTSELKKSRDDQVVIGGAYTLVYDVKDLLFKYLLPKVKNQQVNDEIYKKCKQEIYSY